MYKVQKNKIDTLKKTAGCRPYKQMFNLHLSNVGRYSLKNVNVNSIYAMCEIMRI